jgi:4-hydroxy-tetrahydrodipicolinate synthase
MEPPTICRVGEFKNITMVKEATGSLDQASQILNASGLTVLSGDDSLTLPIMAVGGRGVVSVVGNVVPKDLMALCAAFDAGDVAGAQKWHRKLFPLCRDMLGVATNPIPVKAAMKLLGRGTGELRLPMTPLDAAGEARVRATLKGYGLL